MCYILVKCVLSSLHCYGPNTFFLQHNIKLYQRICSSGKKKTQKGQKQGVMIGQNIPHSKFGSWPKRLTNDLCVTTVKCPFHDMRQDKWNMYFFSFQNSKHLFSFVKSCMFYKCCTQTTQQDHIRLSLVLLAVGKQGHAEAIWIEFHDNNRLQPNSPSLTTTCNYVITVRSSPHYRYLAIKNTHKVLHGFASK